MRKTVELLSPAGNPEAVRAALANGADAVYLGAASFGARSGAGFSEEDLKEAIRFCHLYGRKAHITVNTLVRDDEFLQIRSTLEQLEKMHADAVLVQDIGLLSYIREHFPCFEIHLSTQMALHNRAGADFARSIGADRIVLARECDLSTIREVAATGIDTEVFVHGALCVCVSGQCLLSSSIGGRSGNRGRCAQPCRLEYNFLGRKVAWLSPKDICTRDHLPELIEAQVSSFKIEGRLKRPEYVAYVTGAYRKAIDAYYEGRFLPADDAEKTGLTQIFSRGDFTAGYAFGEQDASVIFPDRASPVGICVGRIGRVIRKGKLILGEMNPEKDIHNGDGLEIGSQNVIYSGPDVPKGKTVLIRLHEACAKGTLVLRQQDEAQLAAARETYREDPLPSCFRIPFDAEINAYPDIPCSLTLSSGNAAVTVKGDVCSKAQKTPVTGESLARAISKTGGTEFILRNWKADTKNAYLSSAAVNELRRKALVSLKEEIISLNEQRLPKESVPESTEAPLYHSEPLLYVRFSNAEDAQDLLLSGADRLIWFPTDYRAPVLKKQLVKLPPQCYVALPLACSDEVLEETKKLICQSGNVPALQNIAQLETCREREDMISLEGIPVFNRHTIRFLLSRGCQVTTVSAELSFEQIEKLVTGPDQMIVCYGRQRLMTLTHCPMRVRLGLSKERDQCNLCEKKKGCSGTGMTDRMNAFHPLIPIRTQDGCRVDLMHEKTLQLSDKTDFLKRTGASILLNFTDEAPETMRMVVHFWRCFLSGLPLPEMPVEPFEGRYTDGVL